MLSCGVERENKLLDSTNISLHRGLPASTHFRCNRLGLHVADRPADSIGCPLDEVFALEHCDRCFHTLVSLPDHLVGFIWLCQQNWKRALSKQGGHSRSFVSSSTGSNDHLLGDLGWSHSIHRFRSRMSLECESRLATDIAK